MEDLDQECARFVSTIHFYFEAALRANHFTLNECLCQRDGRECVAMYQSFCNRLLVVLSDGSVSVLLGTDTADFPGPNAVDPMGRGGWYIVSLLVEMQTGQPVWTEKRLQQFWRGELDAYRFEADLFGEWADRLLPLFAPDHDTSWRDQFHLRFRDPETR